MSELQMFLFEEKHESCVGGRVKTDKVQKNQGKEISPPNQSVNTYTFGRYEVKKCTEASVLCRRRNRTHCLSCACGVFGF